MSAVGTVVTSIWAYVVGTVFGRVRTAAQLALLPGPMPFRSQGVWVADRGASYSWAAGSVLTPNGFTVIGRTGGAGGNWLLNGSAITLSPSGGADAPIITAALASLATYTTGGTTQLTGGVFAVTTPIAFPNNAPVTLRLSASTILNSTIVPLDGHSHSPFFAQHGPLTNHTTLAAPPTVGGNTVTLVDPTGYAIDDWILIQDVRSVGYKIVNLVGPVATLDNLVLFNFGAGSDVWTVPGGFPTGIQILADNGATLQGTGDRGIYIANGIRCTVRGLRVLSSFTNVGIGADWGGRSFRFEDCDLVCVANGAACVAIFHEAGQNPVTQNCTVSGPFSAGIAFDSCVYWSSVSCDAYGPGLGNAFSVQADAGDTIGSYSGDFIACNADGAIIGFQLFGPGDATCLHGCNAKNCTSYGLQTFQSNTRVFGASFTLNAFGIVFNVGAVGAKLYGIKISGNSSAGMALAANTEAQFFGLDTDELTAIGILGNGVSVRLTNWTHTSSMAGFGPALSIQGPTGSYVDADGATFSFLGAGTKVGFFATTQATFNLDRLKVNGALTGWVVDANAGSTVKIGPFVNIGANTLKTDDGTTLYNYGTISVTVVPDTHIQTVPASCVAGDRPPTFTQTAGVASVAAPVVTAVNNGSFNVTFPAAVGTFNWFLP